MPITRSLEEPRHHAVRPKDFGKSGHIQWQQPSTLNGIVGLRHAEIQHHFSMRVKSDIRGRVTQAKLAVGCEMRGTTLNEVLNGRRWIRFEDMLRIEQVVGPILVKMKWDPTPLTHPDLAGRFPTRLAQALAAQEAVG